MDDNLNNNSGDNLQNAENNSPNTSEQQDGGAPQENNAETGRASGINENMGVNNDAGSGNNEGINNLTMDNTGKIRADRVGTAAMIGTVRTFLILGWVSAALTAFISPYFAIIGVLFGVLANRRESGSGNAVIITNVVLAAINIIFGFFLIVSLRRLLFGF